MWVLIMELPPPGMLIKLGYQKVHMYSQCNEFMSTLCDLQQRHDFTKSDIVKHRIAVVDNMFLERCKELSFTFIDNSNIKSNALKDFVHLNYVGERMFRENLKGFWKN